MLGIYYTDTWGAKSLPFMSTSLRSADGSAYPSAEIFPGGNLNHTALAEYGAPKMTGTFAYAMFMANAAVSVDLVLACKPIQLTDRFRSVLWLSIAYYSGARTSSEPSRTRNKVFTVTDTMPTWLEITRRYHTGGTLLSSSSPSSSAWWWSSRKKSRFRSGVML